MYTELADTALVDRYMQAIGKVPLLSQEDESVLAGKVKKGDLQARDQMILANLRLVVKIAYDYANMGVPLVDLISEGNLGLIKAIERYNPTRGGRLATYAAWWIRQSVKQALADQAKSIRLPMHMVEKIARLRRSTAELTAKLGRNPSDEELASATRFGLQRIAQLRSLSSSTQSLETAPPFSLPLQDTLPDETEENPLATLLKKTNQKQLQEALLQIGEREATVLRLRHGIGTDTPATLDEIGQALGLTRERVRQIELEAQTHLRRVLAIDDTQKSRAEVVKEKRSRAKIEVLRQFMLEKGLLK